MGGEIQPTQVCQLEGIAGSQFGNLFKTCFLKMLDDTSYERGILCFLIEAPEFANYIVACLGEIIARSLLSLTGGRKRKEQAGKKGDPNERSPQEHIKASIPKPKRRKWIDQPV